jgi:hypothetical protein
VGDVREEVAALFLAIATIGEEYQPSADVANTYADRALAIVAEAKADRIVVAILRDLTGRSGFDGMWDGTDEDIQEEIIDTWRELVVQELEGVGRE